MADQHRELESLAEGYVFSLLGPEEHRAFEGHLAGCSLCRRRVAEARETLDALQLTLEEREPPPSLRERILLAARGESQLAPAAPTRAWSPRRPFWRTLLARAATPRAFVAGTSAIALILVVLALWIGQLQSDVAVQKTRLAKAQEAISIMSQAEHWRRFEGEGPQGSVGGALAHASAYNASCLVIRGLPKAGDKVYHAWVMRDGEPLNVGPLWPMDSEMWIIIRGDMKGIEALKVTLEQERIVDRPQGPEFVYISMG